jgi:hypothetical protein
LHRSPHAVSKRIPAREAAGLFTLQLKPIRIAMRAFFILVIRAGCIPATGSAKSRMLVAILNAKGPLTHRLDPRLTA